MGCLDDKILSDSLRFAVYSTSIEGFNCRDRDDSIFVLEDKFMIEPMIAVAASALSGGLNCGGDDGICSLDKELDNGSTELVLASTFSAELKRGDTDNTI